MLYNATTCKGSRSRVDLNYRCATLVFSSQTSCCMWSLMTMFLTLSNSCTSDIKEPVAMEMLSAIFEMSSWSICWKMHVCVCVCVCACVCVCVCVCAYVCVTIGYQARKGNPA